MSALQAPPPFIISTAEQSQQIDADTIAEFGIDGFTLMEVAGSSAAKRLLQSYGSNAKGIFLCGKGNNAGDALVVARYVIQYNIDIELVFISGTGDLSQNADKNFSLLKNISKNDPQAGNLLCREAWKDVDPHSESDFIVDGMLGTGLSSNLRGDYRQAAEWANGKAIPVFAIDIPTGLHADSGHVMGNAVKADTTFSFGTLKQGFYLNEGYQYTGNIIFCELPFPNFLKKNCSTYLIDESWIREKPRTPATHKYAGGVLYIIAGSEGLTGAAIMAAKSAWAEGLGAVILISPHGTLEVYEKKLPQIIKKEVGSHKDFHFKSSHTKKVLDIVNEKEGAVLLGPGLGREEETVNFAHNFLGKYHGELLIDADALWALAQIDNWNKPQESQWILTPHPGELARLFGNELKEDPQRVGGVKKIASSKKITLVSKGFPVIIGTQRGDAYLTAYDTRKFSRAGFGDVLAGKIGAYRSLGYSPGMSSVLGLLNGKQKMDALLRKDETYIPEPQDLI